jgi:hypothetical protein
VPTRHMCYILYIIIKKFIKLKFLVIENTDNYSHERFFGISSKVISLDGKK